MRLAMAKAKLTEWEKLADEARQPHQVSVCAAIQWEPDHGWTAEMEWPEEDVRLGAHTVSTCGPESDDPLTAVVEASKQTPWPLEE